jgi:hypothetical protein
LIFVVCLACLAPLTLYCLFLSMINRRRHPVMLSGPWDVAALLFGAGGFLLVAGPAMLNGFNQQWRDYWLFRRPTLAVHGLGDEGWYLWLGIWGCYFALVLGGALWLLRRRRHVLSIYNIDPTIIHEALGQVLDRMKLDWTSAGNYIAIGFKGDLNNGINGAGRLAILAPKRSPVGTSLLPAAEVAEGDLDRHAVNQKLLIEIDPFPAMRHVSLSWPDDAGPLRQEIEMELAKVLADVRTRPNPVSLWLGSIAGCLFTVMFFVLLFFVLATLMTKR